MSFRKLTTEKITCNKCGKTTKMQATAETVFFKCACGNIALNKTGQENNESKRKNCPCKVERTVKDSKR